MRAVLLELKGDLRLSSLEWNMGQLSLEVEREGSCTLSHFLVLKV